MENDALIGQQLGSYLIQSKLGEGGMARVYKAYHARLRREVAIKVILSQVADQADFKVRFEREAQLVASLQHPNIVAVYDFGDYGKLTYLVMQYVGGGTLRDTLRGGHALDPRQATMYTIQMGKALHHAHLRGIVHRDVKPQNMLVSATDPNQLLLSDFGIAKLYDTRHEPTMLNIAGGPVSSDPSLTSVDQIVGTAEYMAPEQINGKPVDARTDVYALGVVLFQMLTGEAPFRSTTIHGLLFQHVYTPPRPVREFNPYVSEALEQIVARAMAKAPADRFQSAEEMAQALEAANTNATYQLPPSVPLRPITGGATHESLTSPSQNRPSFYGPQSQVGTPGAASVYGQQPAFGNTPAYGTSRRTTDPGGAGFVAPPLRHPVRWLPVSSIGAALVILLAIVLVLARTGVLPFLNNGNSSMTVQSFTENFQNNNRNWTQGNLNGLTAGVEHGTYTLQVSDNQTYFPHPNVGTLPDNFTLTVSMEQVSTSSAFYGLAFHWSQNGTSVYCYALIINESGQYQLLKYDPNQSNQYKQIWPSNHPWSAINSGPNKSNTLQATVHGSTFSFMVNGQPVQVGPNATDTSYTDPSNPYTGGQPALVVAGPGTSFLATSVQLTTM